jgi:hypothetical protein
MNYTNDEITNFNNSEDINYKNNFRINYYLGNINKEIITVGNEIKYKITLFDNTEEINKMTIQKILDTRFMDKFYERYCKLTNYFNIIHDEICYFSDFRDYLDNYKTKHNANNIEALIFFGDDTQFKKLPCFVKAKTIGSNDFSVLLKLNVLRHFSSIKKTIAVDIPFATKRNKLLWRGTNTNTDCNTRCNLVDKFYNTKNQNIDIKFSYLCKNFDAIKSEQVDRIMSIQEMLQYKFLLSVEGNDVATNLKWILISNSVVIMPIPKKCSWIMEDMLVPFVHFVPVSVCFSDLEDVFDWCLNNLEKCEEISKNATKFMKQFLDEENEKYITTEVIRKYVKYVKFV